MLSGCTRVPGVWRKLVNNYEPPGIARFAMMSKTRPPGFKLIDVCR
jgi:hypothetical protein